MESSGGGRSRGRAQNAARGAVHLPLRGQRRLAGLWNRVQTNQSRLLLPVELRHESHTASTNGAILSLDSRLDLYNHRSMSQPSPIDQVADRVERLLVRYEELQRTNALLAEQLEATTKERDSLRSRLNAARARVDALLERLPESNAAQTQDTA